MNKRRLLKLADFIEKLPPKKFDMTTIIDAFDEVTGDELDTKKFVLSECGTVACAMGWTPAVFPRLVKWESPDFDIVHKKTGSYNWKAMEELFDIARDDSERLFSSGAEGYETNKEVANGIRKYVQTNGAFVPLFEDFEHHEYCGQEKELEYDCYD